jgi:hypothetical protein
MGLNLINDVSDKRKWKYLCRSQPLKYIRRLTVDVNLVDDAIDVGRQCLKLRSGAQGPGQRLMFSVATYQKHAVTAPGTGMKDCKHSLATVLLSFTDQSLRFYQTHL